jgi:hypothetical protein
MVPQSSRVVPQPAKHGLPPSAVMFGLSWRHVVVPLAVAATATVALAASATMSVSLSSSGVAAVVSIVVLGAAVVLKAALAARRPLVAFDGPLVWVRNNSMWQGPVVLTDVTSVSHRLDRRSESLLDRHVVVLREDSSDTSVTVPLFSPEVVEQLRTFLPSDALTEPCCVVPGRSRSESVCAQSRVAT